EIDPLVVPTVRVCAPVKKVVPTVRFPESVMSRSIVTVPTNGLAIVMLLSVIAGELVAGELPAATLNCTSAPTKGRSPPAQFDALVQSPSVVPTHCGTTAFRLS